MSQGKELAELYTRELSRMEDQIRAYPDEASLWIKQGAQKNAPGTLAMHVAGNLQAYVGAVFGETGYVRDRDFEFAGRRSRDEILEELADTRLLLERILPTLSDEVMDAPFPGTPPPRMEGIRTRPFLLHLLWHVGWHTGHVYYHRLALQDDTEG